MKLRYLFALIAVVPCLGGCITSNTLCEIKHPSPKHLPDYLNCAGASVTSSNQLLIFVEGRLTNSARAGKYTLTIPLTDVKVIPYRATAVNTNSPFSWGSWTAPR